jgi:uncharacterized membrane protein YbhN (UPF0104 family)
MRVVGLVERFQALAALSRRHHRTTVAVQIVVAAILLVALAFAVHGSWANAGERLRDADYVQFGLALVALGAYYLLFVVGFMRILGAWGVAISYTAALRAEMVSMLAKYIPGGVWTPAARIVALRRAGVTDGALVFAAMMVEAGLSAVSGVIVFAVSLVWVHGVNAPLWPLLIFGAVLAVLLHPRVFQPLAARVLRRFGTELPELPDALVLGLLAYYAFTWIVGGTALWLLVRSVGANPPVSAIVFLGGVSAVGATVAVLAIILPSGLGVREASMYGLIVAIAPKGAALGATVLNRLAITVVEIALLLVGGLLFRLRDEDVDVTRLVAETESSSR